jgi:hypothetical protein
VTPSNSPPSDSDFPEKRTFRRYALWFPVTLLPKQHGMAEVWAICRDASAGGILVSSVTLLPVGAELATRFRVAPHGVAERVVEATVVRSELNDGDLMLAFPFRLGLRFTSPVPELPEELARQMEERCHETGLA